MRNRPSLNRRALGALVLLTTVLTTGPSSARTPDSERWWVELPRGSGMDEAPGLPYPPLPNEAARLRRALRGDPEVVARLSRGPSAEALRAVQDSGARIVRVSRWLSAVSVEADAAARATLAARFGESSLAPVRTWAAERPGPAPFEPEPLRRRLPGEAYDYGPARAQLAQIGIDRLHAAGLTGAGITVLVVDTGYRLDHPALASAEVVATWDFVNGDADPGNDPDEPLSQDRHGTGVASVITSNVPGSMVGVAPDARLLLAKTEVVLTETRVEEDNFVAALEWGEALGADVMNASLGYRVFVNEPDGFAYDDADLDGDTAVTTRAVDDLVALGVVAVTSAGNAGPEPRTLLTPADSDSGLAIAAVDSNGVVATFSSRGPTADGRIKPDLAARGVLVQWADTLVPGDYARVSGTSLASPLVAGSAALLLQAHPTWTPGEVATALRATASQAAAPDTVLGWGLVDVHAAVFDVQAPVTPLPFALQSPGEADTVIGPDVRFTWSPARDLQTPEQVVHRIEVSSAEDGTGPVATYEVGPDTTRTVEVPVFGTVWWGVVARDPDGNERATTRRRLEVVRPTGLEGWPARNAFRLEGPWPNPSSGRSVVRVVLGRPATIESVEVFDVSGRHVRTLRRASARSAGEWLVEWDGLDATGRATASGRYLMRAVVLDPAGARTVLSASILRLR